MPENLSIRTHDQMRPVLHSPDASAPETFYFMLRGGVSMGNVTILEPGKAGDEYVKTLGHYHPYDFSETYRVLDGEALMLLQKRKLDEAGNPINSEIEDFKVVKLSAGSQITLPLHFGHVLVNISSTFLITRDDSPSDPATVAVHPHADYAPIVAQKGMAFYCVERDGAPALVRNPTYASVGTTDFAGLPLVA